MTPPTAATSSSSSSSTITTVRLQLPSSSYRPLSTYSRCHCRLTTTDPPSEKKFPAATDQTASAAYAPRACDAWPPNTSDARGSSRTRTLASRRDIVSSRTWLARRSASPALRLTVDSASLTQFTLDDQRFGYAQPDSFYQATEASTQVTPQFHGQQPLQGDVTAANFRSQQSDGKFSVDVKLNAELRVKVWAFKVRGPKTKISCPLSIPAPGNASATFQPTTCKVWF